MRLIGRGLLGFVAGGSLSVRRDDLSHRRRKPLLLHLSPIRWISLEPVDVPCRVIFPSSHDGAEWPLHNLSPARARFRAPMFPTKQKSRLTADDGNQGMPSDDTLEPAAAAEDGRWQSDARSPFERGPRSLCEAVGASPISSVPPLSGSALPPTRRCYGSLLNATTDRFSFWADTHSL